MRHALLSSLLLVAAVQEDPAADLAFQNSRDLLHVQMKIRVLQRLRESGFFIPNAWVRRYLDEQHALNLELDRATKIDVEQIDEWARDVEKVEEAEKDTLEKLAEDWGKKTLKALTEGADEDSDAKGILVVWREYEERQIAWRSKEKRRAYSLARDVQKLIGELRTKAAKSGPAVTAAEKEWRTSLLRLYRGAVDDRADLLEGIKAIERERLYTLGCLKAMSHVTAGLKLLETLQDDRSIAKRVCDGAKDQVSRMLQEAYGGDDPVLKENIGWATDKSYMVLETAYGAWTKLDELGEDPLLKANPTALRTCKRLAILSGMYTVASDLAKECVVLAPIKPLFEVFDFYGKALDLVPQFAKAMQGFVNKVDQDIVDARLLSAWRVVPEEEEPLTRTVLMVQYGIPLAQRRDKYYLLVPEEVVPRKYATLSAGQVERLGQALADERVIFALREASRGLAVVTENLFDWAPANVLAAVASPAYLKDLAEKARKIPFKEGDLLKLAQDQDVEHDGAPGHRSKAWKPADFRRVAEALVDSLAEEFTVRSALPRFRSSAMEDWRAFKDLLGRHQVVLAPQEIVRLFTHYHQGGGDAERVREFLRRTAERRRLNRLGAARLGIPVVTTAPPGRELQPGSQATFVAHGVVSDLKPGREVAGVATWTLPGGAAFEQPVNLGNGVFRLERALTVPAKGVGRNFEVRVAVRVPLEPGEPAAEGGVVVPVGLAPVVAAPKPPAPPRSEVAREVEAPAPPPPPKPAAPAPPNEFKGSGTFAVEVTGPLRISVRRSKQRSTNHIEITSEAIAALDPKSFDQRLRLTTYYGFSPAGPFHPRPGSAMQPISGAAGSFTNEGETIGRLAPDRYLLTDYVSDLARSDIALPHGLIHYRIGQQLEVKGKLVGKEEFSNVILPSGKGRIVFQHLTEGEPPLKPRFSRGDDAGFVQHGVRLSSEDQWFDAWGAHVVVKAGGWVGHYYTRSGSSARWDDSAAAIEWPYLPGGGSVVIEAEGEGLTASLTVPVSADPRHDAWAQEEVKKATKEADDARKRLEEEIASYRRGVAHHEQELAKASGSPDPARPIFARGSLKDHVISLKVLTEVDLKLVDLTLREKSAWASSDVPAALRAAQERLEVEKRRRDLAVEYADGKADTFRKAAAIRREDAARLLKLAEEAKPEKERAEERYRGAALSACAAIRRAAFRAGDASVYREATLRYHSPDLRKAIDYRDLQRVAEEWLVLSGAREAAADLWELSQGVMLHAGNRSPDPRLIKRMKESPPPSWPRPREPKFPPGPFDEPSLLAAIERCLK